jgi:preprotein translocase subunit SecA
MAKTIMRQQEHEEGGDTQEKYKQYLEKFKKETQLEHEKVVALGGLHVLGTERHEARRIDNQLRGRCGRQGDPGLSRFYVSLEDDLMRLFGSDRLAGMMSTLGFEEGQVIEHPWVSRSIEIAQRRVETHNFEIRKQLLEYDNVMNKQREIIYTQRRQILEGTSLKENILGILDGMLGSILGLYFKQDNQMEEEQAAELLNTLHARLGVSVEVAFLAGKNKEQLQEELYDLAVKEYEAKEQAVGAEQLRGLERMVFLQIIDTKWKDHLYAMDKLREGIGLRAYGHRDPLIEYKNEAYAYFSEMVGAIEEESVEMIMRLQASRPERFKAVFKPQAQEMIRPQIEAFEKTGSQQEPATPRADRNCAGVSPSAPKAGRNDPCPCGSGKKYKKCCGQ